MHSVEMPLIDLLLSFSLEKRRRLSIDRMLCVLQFIYTTLSTEISLLRTLRDERFYAMLGLGPVDILTQTLKSRMDFKQATRTVYLAPLYDRKNVVKGYSEMEVKVRQATCNDKVRQSA